MLDQVIGTGLLLVGIFAVGDDVQWKPALDASPFAKAAAVAILVVAIGMCFGFNTGYAINPARDLAPRIFLSLAGWGSAVFEIGGGWYWFLVPCVGPVLGGLLGSTLFQVCVGFHHPQQDPSHAYQGKPYISPRHCE